MTTLVNRCASTHFGENQLAPSSIGISPLTTTHPPIFQHRSVRTSTWCYPSFLLVMVRSPGFGSIGSDFMPCQDSLSLWLRRNILNLATPYKSPAHSSTGTRSGNHTLPLLESLRFHVLFHSPTGVLFHLSLAVLFTIGHPGVFSLTRWSSLIHTGFHVPHATRDKIISKLLGFQLLDFHHLWCRFQLLRLAKSILPSYLFLKHKVFTGFFSSFAVLSSCFFETTAKELKKLGKRNFFYPPTTPTI
jgi:hypothetical protein